MKKTFRFFTAGLLSILFALAAHAQSITVSGNIKNSVTKEVVPAVSVVVKGSSTGTYSNQDGAFSLSVPKLPVTLVLSSIGYDNLEITVADAATAVDVEFKPNTTLGQEVVVAATRTPTRILESPVTVERLSGATLRNVPAPSYYEALANLKGVDMHTASLTFRTVTTRGFVSSGNTKLNQLIDGMDNQAPGLNFSVGSIIGPTELDVDNVELLAGASSALYGSGGMNGTVLITSKNPFKYQGLSFNIKQGINHINDDNRGVAPYYDWTIRYAKAFKDKFAFKLSAQMVQAQDWEADDYRNVARTNILSKVVGGNRSSDPNYDGVNMYGDETSQNMQGIANLVLASGTRAFIQQYMAATGGMTPSQAQINGFLGSNSQTAPFYNGLQAGLIPNQNVSREGYKERDLVDYNTYNVKLSGALHYKITPGIEASFSTYFGTGTTVYTGADRYSLRNLKIAQHKLEVRAKNWFVRGYTTQENAGDATQATALGRLMNEAYKPSQTWYPQYVAAFTSYMAAAGAGGANSYDQAHAFARGFADSAGGTRRFQPGTAAFDQAKNNIMNTPLPQGAKFLDRTDLWVGEAQLNLSETLGFSEMVEVLVGGQFRQNVLNSRGTLFTDTLGVIKVNEYGGYIQLKKDLGELLTLTASGRYDKHENFEGRFTPRVTAVFHVAKDNNIRLSYQTAYRFPTNQDQYINLNTGSAFLIGGLPDFQDKYQLNTGTYTAESVAAARAAGNPALLQESQFTAMKPESVSSYEIGYKGLVAKRLLLDGYFYYSQYTDFLARTAVVKAATPAQALDPGQSTNFSYQQNTSTKVKTYGWGVSADYQAVGTYFIYGNLFSDVIRDLPEGFISFFNAPKYRFNVGLRNENLYKGIGFNAVVKWQDNNYYEGTFVTGTLPYYTTVDAQITYRPKQSKSVWRIGGTNLGNNYYRSGYGSPAVGGLYYVSYGYNIF
ncbi:MAG: TonB-dependent receptor [Chitinophagaceae bacterium]|nr:MAG: TonB-dependent receptor [Chitinophagaceae bacterium]